MGNQLDSDEPDRLNGRLRTALPGYDIRSTISRGSQRGRIKVVFEVTEGEALRWLRFTPTRSKLIFHENQGWSGVLDIPMGGRDHRVTLNLVADNADDLEDVDLIESREGVAVEEVAVGVDDVRVLGGAGVEGEAVLAERQALLGHGGEVQAHEDRPVVCRIDRDRLHSDAGVVIAGAKLAVHAGADEGGGAGVEGVGVDRLVELDPDGVDDLPGLRVHRAGDRAGVDAGHDGPVEADDLEGARDVQAAAGDEPVLHRGQHVHSVHQRSTHLLR